MSDGTLTQNTSNPKCLPWIPCPAQLWRSIYFWISIAYILIILRAVPQIFVEFWFLKHLELESVFWTNFSVHFFLFAIGIVLFALTIYLPIRLLAVTPTLRKTGLHIGLWAGILAGWLLSFSYQKYLLFFNAGSFGTQDPVFGRDIGFYVFILPAIRTTLTFLIILAVTGVVFSLIARTNQIHAHGG